MKDDQKAKKQLDELKNLRKEIEETNDSFIKKTDQLIGDLKINLDKAEKGFEEDEKILNQTEKEAVNEMDKIVLDFLR